MLMICACSSDESPTNVNAGQNQQGQNGNLSIPVSSSSFGTSNPEFSNDASSSSETFNSELPTGESSSAIIENTKKSKFETVEAQYFYENSKGELYLNFEIKYSNYQIFSDSSESYQYTQSNYNEGGLETVHVTANASRQGLKTTSNSEANYYNYSTGEQIVSTKLLYESESSIDEEILWTTFSYTKTTSIVEGKQTESISTQTTTKEFVKESEKGREYILHHINNGIENSSTHVIVDTDGFVTEALVYNSDNSLSSANFYKRLPNAPESISKSALCRSVLVNESSLYEYYNTTCEDVVNTSDEYKLIVKETYKSKTSNQIHHSESHYTFRKFEY